MLSTTVTVIVLLLPCALAQGGGMAELKSITGDAPYSGVGNAPAVIPQPMGFWGRPRYSPMGYGGGGFGNGYGSGFGGGPFGSSGSMYGGNSFGGGPDRFTSVGRSPYESSGINTFDSDEDDFRPRPFYGGGGGLLGALTSLMMGTPSRSMASPSVRSIPSDSLRSLFNNDPSSSSASLSPRSVSPSMSSLSGGLGGFYKGRGN